MTGTSNDSEHPAENVNPPALPAPITPPLDPQMLGMLAREISVNVEDRNHLLTVLGRYRLTEAQYEQIKVNPFFAQALATEIITWNSTLNTKQRLGVQAAWYLEQGFAPLAARMMDKDESLAAAIEAAKLFARIAGVGERVPGEAQAGEKVVINIDLGQGRTIQLTKDIAPPSSAGAICIDAEGESDEPEIRSLSEGP